MIFAGSGETADEIGKSVAFISDFKAYVGGDAVIFSPKVELDSIFLSYQLNGNRVREELQKLGQGSSVIHIYSSNLSELDVLFPPLVEQEKIADVLTSLDDQIESIELKLVQLESLKKSLMGDLLTGRVRVSVD